MNALSFPRSGSGYDHRLSRHFATDVAAWISTEGKVVCEDDMMFPTGDMRWGLAALKGAVHWVHIDSDGFGTFIDVKCGMKYWMILKPKNKQEWGLDRIGAFHHPGFSLNEPSSELFDVEAVALHPGSTLWVFLINTD